MKINEIKWDHYPRAEPNQKQVELYRLAIDDLPPIYVNPNGYGIDGKHRCLAYLQEGRDEINVTVIDILDEEVLVESIRRNATHGLQLAMADKRRLAPMLYATIEVDEIARLLSVHRNSVLNWTKDLREEETKEEDRIIWNMYLACATHQKIADTVGLTQPTISERIIGLHKDVEIYNPDPLKVFNIWNFSKPDERFGIKHPGRIPGQILQNLLHYYTEPEDVVWDLFGGGGVTIDVCKHMARRYAAWDIRPVRDDIMKHDITTGLPDFRPDLKPKLIFLDPPYWKQKRGDYSDHETNLANMSLSKFHNELEKIVNISLAKAEYVALIIGPTQKKWRFTDHAAEIMCRIGPPHHRIQVPYSTEIHGGAYVKNAKENKQWLYLTRDLMIWEAQHGTTE